MPDDTLYTAVVSFATFAELQQQVDLLQKSMPKALRLERFTDMPHASGGVNYWRSLPPPTTIFKKNIIDLSLAKLCFFSDDPQSTALIRNAVDYFFDLELVDDEEIFLSFCIDCTYELWRSVAAGRLSMRPYVTLPKNPVRSRAQAYVPEVCRIAEEFETDMPFRFEYIEGEHTDLLISSGAALTAAFSRSPVIQATNRPSIDWEQYRENLRPAFQKMIQGADEIAFEFIFTGPIEHLSRRMAMFETHLGDIFTNTFVVYGFDHAYDPLLGLRDASIPQSAPARFPILHKTIVLSKSDVELQIDGLLDASGIYGLELQCHDRRRFEKLKQATNLDWIDGSDAIGRWQHLPDPSR